MRFDVRPILYAPGKKLAFDFALDLSGVEFAGRFPAVEPVRAVGSVRNSADVLTLDMTVSTTLHTCCDRCGKELLVKKSVPYTCILAQEVQDDDSDEIVLLEDGQADVEELARTAFILDMDSKFLCSEDCKGLCPRCGADLNKGPCSCGRDPDPRLAVLAALLKKQESTIQTEKEV